MHGLKPEYLQHLIDCLCGEDVTCICVGEFQIVFGTGPKGGGISVEGRCELMDANEQLLDAWDRGTRSADFRFFELLGKTIQSVNIDSDKSFEASFSNGQKLRVIDDSEQYESFSVGGLFV